MHPIDQKLKAIANRATKDNLDPLTVRILLKEYLQSHILFAIFNSEIGNDLVFYGGTALRKIYGLDRMSEDLDFEVNRPVKLKEIADKILVYFSHLGLKGVECKIQDGEKIGRLTFKFQLLSKLELSAFDTEKLHVKVEINQRLKDSFETELSPLIEDQMSAMIKHYSLPVMMAGKMVACVTRVFKKGATGITVKGRDYYDLIWYMNQKIEPNEKYLDKLGYKVESIWRELDKKIELIKPKDLLLDLQPFFSSRKYIKDWCSNFPLMYQKYRRVYN
jgi:predicted nucleotidyltransferase component of viral defense system